MKSKVQFDLTGQNDAVITARIVHSDDVRDKVARSIKEKLGGSILMTAYFMHSEEGEHEIEIRPLPDSWESKCELASLFDDDNLHTFIQAFQRELNYRKRTGAPPRYYLSKYHGYPNDPYPAYDDKMDAPKAQIELLSELSDQQLTNIQKVIPKEIARRQKSIV